MFCTRSQRSTHIFTFPLTHRHHNYASDVCRRTFVTHQDAASSSLLSSALDQKQRGARLNREDSVGPFTLGISERSLKHDKKVKQWSQLSTGGKGAHTFHHFIVTSCHLAFILISETVQLTALYSASNHSAHYEPCRHSFGCWIFCCPHICSHIGAIFKELAYCHLQ